MENIFVQMHLATIKKLSPQVFNGLQILLVIKGCIQVHVNKQLHVLKTNDLILLNRQDVFSVEGNESNIVLVLKVPFEYMREECEDMLQYAFSCCSVMDDERKQNYDEIRRILIHMLLTYSRLAEGYRLDIRANLFQLLHYLLINFRQASLDIPVTLSKKKDRRISSILTYINEHYRHDITLESLAKREFVSVHYLSKLFKAQMGVGFLDYLNKKRLESAMMDLMYTDKSIIKIALINGFASAKSFTLTFKKQYGQTPNKFRAENLRESSPESYAEYERLSVDELGGFPELVKYLQFYEKGYEESTKTDVLYRSISIDTEGVTVRPFKKILRIGKWSDALTVEVQNQLNLAQKKLKCDYVHFQGIFCDGIFQYTDQSIYSYYDYNQTISYFRGIGLIPFIRINLSEVIRSELTVENACEMLGAFLINMRKYFSKSYVEEWLFEIIHFEDVSEAQYFIYFQNLYRKFKEFSPNINVGMFSIAELNEYQLARFKHELLVCTENETQPDFITFKAEPDIKDDSLGMQVDSFKQLNGFHGNMVRKIHQTITECGLPKIPLYATEWNTIAGKSLLEVRSFYRAALILKAMLDMTEHVEGLSFWLNEQISERMHGIRHYILSLFHCFTAKRPAFFTLQALTRLGLNVLHRDENIVVTKNRQGDFVIMVNNPCYFNPVHAMDYNFIRDYERKFVLALNHLNSGLYQFKVFNFKMNFSFAINSNNALHGLSDVQAYKYNDEDMLEHIESIAAPEFTVYEEFINETGTLKLNLSFNAVALYIIRKL